jgi:alkylation response protein AidB-like acyl-CoA dehydrogenase
MAAVPQSPFLDTVAALAPQIEAAADENERTRRLSVPLVGAMAQAGLFRLWRPRSLGGEESDPITVLRVVEAVSRIDGAAGWCVAVHGNGSLPSGYLPREGAREIFGSDPNTITAGTWPPLGEAVVVEGGYRATGRWPFASGCQHAQWIQAGCRIIDGDQPRLRADGTPVARVLFFPAASCEILDTWHTAGMRGTGSHDFTVTNVSVPFEHSVSFREPPVELGPLYAFPTIGLSASAIAAVALGIARHAIDILSEVARVKVAMRSQRVLSQHATLQADLGRAEGLLRAGREAHIAVDPEDAAPGVADERQPGLFQGRPDRDDEVPQRRQHFCVVDRLLRPEPVRVVVMAQFPEKPERRRPEPGKRNTGGGHRLLSSLPGIGPQCSRKLRGPNIAGGGWRS